MLKLYRLMLAMGLLVNAVMLLRGGLASAAPLLQAATPSPEGGPRVEVYDDVNVRAGPGTDYDLIGYLIRGQRADIYGRSADNKWVKVVYVGGPENTGWVYVPLVRIVGDVPSFPIVQPPATPTRPPTATPEIAVDTGTATPVPPGLPTFTPPAVIVRPTLLPRAGVAQPGWALPFPPALIIISLLTLGGLGLLMSLLRRG